MLSNLIEAGNKVDIQMMNYTEMTSKMIESPRMYKSQIIDIMENGDIEILMPMERGKLLLLSLGVRYEFVFYAETGLYKAVGEVKERYKSGNKFLLQVSFHTPLSKYQRREYYRLECVLDFTYFLITKDVAELEATEDIVLKLEENNNFEADMHQGIIIDISGGGIRFRVDEQIEVNTFLLMYIKLGRNDSALGYPMVGRIISCNKVEEVFGKYEYRIEFVFKEKDTKVREEIIKFIFAEQRKNRNNGKG